MYPSDRLEYMLKEGNPSVILSHRKFIELFDRKKIIEINDVLFNNQSEENISGSLPPDNLAYVIYT